MKVRFNILEIPCLCFQGNINGKRMYSEESSRIVSIDGRMIVVVDINGYKQPFYLSTGYGGKKDVPEGKWYPFFGIHPETNWINKLKSKDILSYYNIRLLKEICEMLDSQVGDRRNSSNVPALSVREYNPAFKFINQSFNTVADNESSDTFDIVTKNVEQSRTILNNIYEKYIQKNKR